MPIVLPPDVTLGPFPTSLGTSLATQVAGVLAADAGPFRRHGQPSSARRVVAVRAYREMIRSVQCQRW
jgi:hypothetical protein